MESYFRNYFTKPTPRYVTETDILLSLKVPPSFSQITETGTIAAQAFRRERRTPGNEVTVTAPVE